MSRDQDREDQVLKDLLRDAARAHEEHDEIPDLPPPKPKKPKPRDPSN